MRKIILEKTKKYFNKNKESLLNSNDPKKLCYLIGNGPSLGNQDLSLLNDSCNITCNNFVKHKNIENIKIDYYCISDPKFIHDEELFESLLEIEEISQYNKEMVKIYPVRFLFNFHFLLNHLYRDTYFININSNKKIWELGDINFDLTKDLYWGHTIMLDICIPLAVFLGFKEIRLLGCDTNYDPDQTHFYGSKQKKDYNEIDKNRSSWYDIVNEGYRIAAKKASKIGVNIYDCTYEGKINTLKKKRLKFLE